MSTTAVQHECAIDDRNSNQSGIEGSNHRAAKYHIFVCKSRELGLKSCITFEENHGFEALKCMREDVCTTLKGRTLGEETVKSRFP